MYYLTFHIIHINYYYNPHKKTNLHSLFYNIHKYAEKIANDF